MYYEYEWEEGIIKVGARTIYLIGREKEVFEKMYLKGELVGIKEFGIRKEKAVEVLDRLKEKLRPEIEVLHYINKEMYSISPNYYQLRNIKKWERGEE